MLHTLSFRYGFTICLIGLVWQLPIFTFASEPNLLQLGEKHHTHLLTISSDKNAIRFYNKTVRPTLGLRRNRTHLNRRASPRLTSPDEQTHVTTLVANLVASRLAITIQSRAQQRGISFIHPLPEEQHIVRDWVSEKSIPTSTMKMLTFNRHAANYFNTVTGLPKRPPQFDDFAQYVEQQFPTLTDAEDSWIGLLEEGRLPDLSHRLSEYWEHTSAQNEQASPTSIPKDIDIDRYAQYYALTRLFPIVRTHLVALTIRSQPETVQWAQQSLDKIKKWHLDQFSQQSHARLCGKWHWTVHNHQNHGDHHMTIFLGHSSQPPSNQPQPTEIKINGNTVYLFWKFPRGYQEDSLLLSNNDKRLEGTFTNTLGPYGSIMGKRLTTCKP